MIHHKRTFIDEINNIKEFLYISFLCIKILNVCFPFPHLSVSFNRWTFVPAFSHTKTLSKAQQKKEKKWNDEEQNELICLTELFWLVPSHLFYTI